jgi:hypothetical protein
MVVKILAGIGLLVLVWVLLRYALALRYAKIARERSRAEEESRGRRVVAEIPADEGLALFTEDQDRFYWAGREVRKREIAGVRMLVNGAAAATAARPGAALPDPPAAESSEGRERWEVVLYLRDGGAALVRCGSLREGISRDIAARVYEAARAAVTA